MSILSHPRTYEDLLQEREHRRERLELVGGELVVTPSPSPMHQVVAHRLGVILDRAVVETGRGVVMESPDVYFDVENVPEPDLVVLLRERKEQFGSTRIEGAPDLAIEILSPSTRAYDRRAKRELYALNEVPEYWLVDTEEETVTICSSPCNGRYSVESESSDVVSSATIPGLTVDLAMLFAPAFPE